jgi:hypothetical protein
MFDSIYYIKLSSGEEILAQKVSENTFKACVSINFIPQDSGQIGLQMIPWPFGFDPDIEIPLNPSVFAFCVPAPMELKNVYNEKFGSGIQIVENPGILHG